MPFVSIPTTSLPQRNANAHFCSIHQVLLSSSSIRTKSRGLAIPIYSSRASSSSDLVAEWLTCLLLCIECLVGLETECSPFDSGPRGQVNAFSCLSFCLNSYLFHPTQCQCPLLQHISTTIAFNQASRPRHPDILVPSIKFIRPGGGMVHVFALVCHY